MIKAHTGYAKIQIPLFLPSIEIVGFNWEPVASDPHWLRFSRKTLNMYCTNPCFMHAILYICIPWYFSRASSTEIKAKESLVFW